MLSKTKMGNRTWDTFMPGRLSKKSANRYPRVTQGDALMIYDFNSLKFLLLKSTFSKKLMSKCYRKKKTKDIEKLKY